MDVSAEMLLTVSLEKRTEGRNAGDEERSLGAETRALLGPDI